MRMLRVGLIFCAALSAAPATAQQTFDDIWSHASLYNKPAASGLQDFSLSGRAHVDGVAVDADEGDHHDLLWRRFRFGAVAKFTGDVKVHIEADFDLNESIDESYSQLTDAYIAWSPWQDWESKILKQSAGFTLDGATSSRKLFTPERNNLTNNLWFTAEYFTGWLLQGPCAELSHCEFGVFSSSGSAELSDFDASWFTLVSLEHDFAAAWGQEQALLRVDYVHNDEDASANTRPFTDVLSLVGHWQQGRWDVNAELAGGIGFDGQSDVAGLVVMPMYDITPRWQVVGRYTRLDSSDDHGIRLNRYEAEIVAERGDAYQELFVGLNWFIYGHKLKWQSGLQYTRMDDSSGSSGDFDG